MIPITQAECLSAPASRLGEGPVWDSQRNILWWVDITSGSLRSLDLHNQRCLTYPMPERPTALTFIEGSTDLLVVLEKRLVRVSARAELIETLCPIEEAVPGNRTNDAKCDPAGRLWFGTMSDEGRAESGVLYRYQYGQALPEAIFDGLSIPNGMAWSADARTFFFVDSRERAIWAFDYDVCTGALSNRRTVIKVAASQGLPDGMAIDEHDNLWIAHWGDGCVRCWSPRTGNLLTQIRVDAANSTSCCFVGSGPSRLFITSAGGEPELSSGTAVGGRLFCAPVEVSGGRVHSFVAE